jgi:hypothetical protein
MHCAASNYLLGRSGLEIFVANLGGLAWNESGWDGCITQSVERRGCICLSLAPLAFSLYGSCNTPRLICFLLLSSLLLFESWQRFRAWLVRSSCLSAAVYLGSLMMMMKEVIHVKA